MMLLHLQAALHCDAFYRQVVAVADAAGLAVQARDDGLPVEQAQRLQELMHDMRRTYAALHTLMYFKVLTVSQVRVGVQHSPHVRSVAHSRVALRS